MKRSSIRKVSERGDLRKAIGRLHLASLVAQRGPYCEICERPAQEGEPFARFHILTVASQPRLEFADKNVLVYIKSHWNVCHEPYHMDRDSKAGRKIMDRIIALRGPDYKEKLWKQVRFMQQHSGLYLRARFQELTEELNNA